MLSVTRDKKTVRINIDTDLPYSDGEHSVRMQFDCECDETYSAELLLRYIRNRIQNAVSTAREDAYNQGWSDAKKRLTKADYFPGWL